MSTVTAIRLLVFSFLIVTFYSFTAYGTDLKFVEFGKKPIAYKIIKEFPSLALMNFSNAEKDEVQKKIKHTLRDDRKSFLNHISEFNPMIYNGKEETAIFNAIVSVQRFGPKIISIKFDYSYEIPRENPINFVRTLNWDTESKSEVKIENLVNLNKLSDLARAIIIEKRLIKETEGDLSEAELKWLNEGTKPNTENFSNFFLSDKSLELYFDPYQIACGAVGAVSVQLDWKKIESFLGGQDARAPEGVS